MKVRFKESGSGRIVLEEGDLSFGCGIPAEGESVRITQVPYVVKRRRWTYSNHRWTVTIVLADG